MVLLKQAQEILADPYTMGLTGLEFLESRPLKLPGALLMICDRGQAQLGIDILKEHIYPGYGIILLPGQILTLHRASPGFESRYFYMSDQVFKEAAYKVDGDFFQFVKRNPVMRLGKTNKVFVKNWVSLARRIIEQENHIFRDSIIRNLMQCLFCEANDKMKRFFNDGRIKSNRREELFREFMLMVKDHCREYREVDYYAGRLFITPRYLSFICSRSANNLSPKKIIDMQAVLEIKIMLETTNDPLQKIAERMNFPDQSYFGRLFKRYTGQSPLSYRLHRKE